MFSLRVFWPTGLHGLACGYEFSGDVSSPTYTSHYPSQRQGFTKDGLLQALEDVCLGLSLMGGVCFRHCTASGLWFLSTDSQHHEAVPAGRSDGLQGIDGFPTKLYPSYVWVPSILYLLLLINPFPSCFKKKQNKTFFSYFPCKSQSIFSHTIVNRCL